MFDTRLLLEVYFAGKQCDPFQRGDFIFAKLVD